MQQTGSATNAHKQPVSWMRLVEKGRHSANNRAQVCEDSKPPKPHNLKATLQCLVQHHIHYNCSNLENAKSSRSVSTSTSKRLHLALSSSCTQVPFTNRDDNTLFRRQAFQSSPTPPTPSAPPTPPPHPPSAPLRPPSKKSSTSPCPSLCCPRVLWRLQNLGLLVNAVHLTSRVQIGLRPSGGGRPSLSVTTIDSVIVFKRA